VSGGREAKRNQDRPVGFAAKARRHVMSRGAESRKGEADSEPVRENVFPLRHRGRPHSPMKLGPEVDSPPWYLGGEVLHVSLMMEPEKARSLVPQPLDIGPNPGEAALWFTEWVSASESRPDLAFMFPEKAIYRECMVMVACQYQGTRGYFVPYSWVDSGSSQVRGLIQGFPRKADRISLTRLHPLNPKLGGRRPGARVKGVCFAEGQRLLEGSLLFSRESEPSAVPSTKLFFLHRFQMIEHYDRAAVDELTTGRVSEARITDVWAGEGEVTFFDSPFEDFSALKGMRVTGGLHFSMGLTIAGGEVVYKYV
jgi:acetoacetate decarboxylase